LRIKAIEDALRLIENHIYFINTDYICIFARINIHNHGYEVNFKTRQICD